MSASSFSGRAKGVESPSDVFAPVAPDDGQDLPLGMTRGLFIGQAGVFTVLDARGAAAQFTSNDAQYHPLRVTRVLATATTATGIVALY